MIWCTYLKRMEHGDDLEGIDRDFDDMDDIDDIDPDITAEILQKWDHIMDSTDKKS